MVGEKIKTLRTKKAWTIRELEERSDVSNVMISRYETGKANPTPKVLQRLASAFEVPVEEFYEVKTFQHESISFDQVAFQNKLQKVLTIGIKEKKIIEGVLDAILTNWEIKNKFNES